MFDLLGANLPPNLGPKPGQMKMEINDWIFFFCGMLETCLELFFCAAGWIEAVGWCFFHLKSVQHSACEFSL